MKLVLMHSSGHDAERLYNVPDELFEEIKEFDKQHGCWSDSFKAGMTHDNRPDVALIEKMAPYLVEVDISCCEYC